MDILSLVHDLASRMYVHKNLRYWSTYWSCHDHEHTRQSTIESMSLTNLSMHTIGCVPTLNVANFVCVDDNDKHSHKKTAHFTYFFSITFRSKAFYSVGVLSAAFCLLFRFFPTKLVAMLSRYSTLSFVVSFRRQWELIF